MTILEKCLVVVGKKRVYCTCIVILMNIVAIVVNSVPNYNYDNTSSVCQLELWMCAESIIIIVLNTMVMLLTQLLSIQQLRQRDSSLWCEGFPQWWVWIQQLCIHQSPRGYWVLYRQQAQQCLPQFTCKLAFLIADKCTIDGWTLANLSKITWCNGVTWNYLCNKEHYISQLS